jgi:hypothetical protein
MKTLSAITAAALLTIGSRAYAQTKPVEGCVQENNQRVCIANVRDTTVAFEDRGFKAWVYDRRVDNKPPQRVLEISSYLCRCDDADKKYIAEKTAGKYDIVYKEK